MPSDKEWEMKVRNMFAVLKKEKEQRSVILDGKEIIILPNVFSPATFAESLWFAKHIAQIVGKKSLLEIGTGTGITALFSALNGAKVVATDINPAAVNNAKMNFSKYALNIPVYLGDLYSPLPKGSKFDFIFWNHPFNKGREQVEESLLKSVFDYNYESFERYVAESNKYLNPKGKLLLGTGSIALISELEQIASKLGYKMLLLYKIETPSEVDSSIYNDYRIYHISKEN